MAYRYYSTQRPLGPGTIPRPADNRITDLVNFDTRTPVPEINRYAWGFVEYEKQLTCATWSEYELKPLQMTHD